MEQEKYHIEVKLKINEAVKKSLLKKIKTARMYLGRCNVRQVGDLITDTFVLECIVKTKQSLLITHTVATCIRTSDDLREDSDFIISNTTVLNLDRYEGVLKKITKEVLEYIMSNKAKKEKKILNKLTVPAKKPSKIPRIRVDTKI